MLTLLLMVTVIIIGAAAILPAIKFEITRDREEEMIHRGVQYSRAIRTYYKKFGRYPARLEDLDNTNNLRFLRKHYKDPVTGKDFKLLHYGEVKMTLSSPLGGAGINGATSLNGASPASNSPFGAAPGTPAGTASQASPQSPLSTPDPNADPNQPADPKQPGAPAGQQPGTTSGSGDALSGQTFGGAPIVGVVSISKLTGIRSFNQKSKYSDWQFIYDPTSDRGGLLNTPNQPPPMQNLNTQPGQSGQPGTPNGNSPFGPQPGNNPNPVPPPNPNPGGSALTPPPDQQ
jgi:type II secretory pathway pseudopilin PulG